MNKFFTYADVIVKDDLLSSTFNFMPLIAIGCMIVPIVIVAIVILAKSSKDKNKTE